MILLRTQNLDDGTEFTLESDDANMTGDFDINVSGTVNITAMGNATASLYADNETTAGSGTHAVGSNSRKNCIGWRRYAGEVEERTAQASHRSSQSLM